MPTTKKVQSGKEEKKSLITETPQCAAQVKGFSPRPIITKGSRALVISAMRLAPSVEIIKHGSSDGIGMHFLIKKGVRIGVVDDLKKRIGLTDKQMAEYLGTSSATLQRKRTTKIKEISFVEGDRLYRMKRILEKATALFRDEAAAAEWLKSPQLGLGDCIPFDLIATEAGAREVEDLLGRIEHGVIS